MQEYTCFECGISSQFGDCHKISCSSKSLMESYVNLLNNLHKFPVDMLNKLEFAVHVEIMEKGSIDIQKAVEEMRSGRINAKLIKALLTGCTCMTKTPHVEYHKTGCAYRTAWENYHKGEKKMNKQEWVKEAFRYMVSLTGEWEYPENLTDYCESLYEEYVERSDPDDYWTPKAAVDEDMTYWD